MVKILQGHLRFFPPFQFSEMSTCESRGIPEGDTRPGRVGRYLICMYMYGMYVYVLTYVYAISISIFAHYIPASRALEAMIILTLPLCRSRNTSSLNCSEYHECGVVYCSVLYCNVM